MIKDEFEDEDGIFDAKHNDGIHLEYAKVKLLAVIADELRTLHARGTEEQTL